MANEYDEKHNNLATFSLINIFNVAIEGKNISPVKHNSARFLISKAIPVTYCLNYGVPSSKL